ncbi:hypothetical protein ABMY26_06660 (plasmid) [Azospirillum sp. HJ39]|uniref:hypothetical protein n=1 Tax=Azospirillum sp. HJ39 TaxID=3159496 RepID=UPI0035573C56
MFEMTIDTGNAAFGDAPEYEVARILRAIADKVEGGWLEGKAIDINGNTVGEFKLTA